MSSKILVDEITGKTTAGLVKFPDKPAFYAKVNSTQSNMALNSYQEIPFDNIIFNQGSHFDGDRFTAPVTGVYHFSCYIRVDSLDTASGYYLIAWGIDGDNIQGEVIDPNFSSDLNYFGFNSSLTYYLTASQTVRVRYFQSVGTAQTDIGTDSWFSGHLVG